MKTAVTQLIERLKNDWNIVLSDNVVDFYLKEEKDQIINAFNYKYINLNKDVNEYLKETYTQSSE